MNLLLVFLLAAVSRGTSNAQPADGMSCELAGSRAARCRGRALRRVPAALHPDVRRVDLSGNLITSIPETPLSLYAALRCLDLSSNQIGFIAPGVFARMTSLLEINLAHNHLYELARNGTGGIGLLPKVEVLDLSHNSLYNGMAEHFIREAPALRYLSLAGNSIIVISHEMFRGSPSLEEIDLQSNIIMEIEEGAFEALVNLSRLNLAMNSITCISDFNLRQLEILDLSRNSIETFHTAAPGGDYRLRRLDLSENKLLQLPVFPQVSKLVTLNLSKNLIRLAGGSPRSQPGHAGAEWLDDAFQLLDQKQARNRSSPDLSQLVYLDLSYNEIRSIPEGFFESTRSLHTLNLSRNCLQAFAAAASGSALGSLAALDLSHNALQTLLLDASAVASLEELYVQNNRLQTLRFDVFSSLPSLRLLDLQSNNVSLCRSPSGLARRRPPGEAGGGCVSFAGAPALRHLCLADNALRLLPAHAFRGTPLAVLDVSGNPGLQIEGEALAGLEQSLERLRLHGNGLAELNVDLPSFGRLRHLNLSENRLSWLPRWSGRSPLEVLDLRNNRFRALQDSNIPALQGSLRGLYLAGNPLDCCGNAWLWALLRGERVRIPGAERLTCRRGRDFGRREETRVGDVRPEDCGKEDLKKTNVLAILAFALVLSVAGIALGSFFFFRRQSLSHQFKA